MELLKLAYDANDLLEMVPICRSSIYNEIKKGNLRPKKMGRRNIFLREDVKNWLENMCQSKGEMK